MSENRFWSARLLCELILIGLICTGTALAQMDPPSPPTKPAGNPPDAATKTRARQVTRSATVEKAVGTASENKAPQPAEDPWFTTQREQINAATAPAERTRLQFQLADQLAEAGMKSEAIAELHLLAAEERFDPSGLFNIGNRLVRLGDAPGAIEAYRKAIDQRKGNYSRALNNLGVVLLEMGQWDQSYDALTSALRLERFRYAEASYNLGRLYAARGEKDLAIREWRRVLAVDPQHARAALAIRDSGSDGNITITKKTAGMPASEDKVNDKPRAAPATRALTVDQASYDLLQRARNDRDHGRNEAAAQEYRGLLARTGGYFAPANLELAYALIALRRNDEAITSLLAVSRNDGARYPIAYYHLGRLYELDGQLKLAEENYGRAAVAYADDNPQFLLDLSRVREKLGDFAGALSTFELYVQACERAGQKPDWADERVSRLRHKITGSPAAPPRK